MYQDQKQSPLRPGVWLPLMFALVLVAGMLIGMRMQSAAPSVVIDRNELDPTTAGQGKIEELIRYIEAKYVDEVDRNKLIQDAIDHILEELDPHSTYIPAEQLQEVNEQLEGNFDGIGVEFMIIDDTIVVVSPLAGGPSEAAGILAGDKIVMIEDSTIAGLPLDNGDIVRMLRGEKGTQVSIGILRGAETEVRRFTITRDKIPVHSVDIAYMINEKTGYIKINRFSATTHEEFMQGLETLVEKQGMKDLIIDLRHNPGGYLQQATNILSQLFREKSKLLVFTEGRAVSRSDYESTGRAFFPVGNIAVLIDEGSASASEILAGAIQDHDRGVIIGRRSFGKGLVQEQYRLRDGSALRLTVARYFTPSGRSIQKPYADRGHYENDVLARLEAGELSDEKKMAVLDSTKYFTANGHVVYGGGGISPDVFVPIDTLQLDDLFLDLRQHTPGFIFRYMGEHDGAFKSYSLTAFNQQYEVGEGLLSEFLRFAAEKGVKPDQARLTRLKPEVKQMLKARMARQLFGDEGFYTVWNKKDQVVQKALEVLGKPNPLAVIKGE